MQGAGVYAGSCDDLAVTEEQIAIAKETVNHETSARPSARCPSKSNIRPRLAVVEM